MPKKKRTLSKCVNCKYELSEEERRNPICPKCGQRWDGGFIKPDRAAQKVRSNHRIFQASNSTMSTGAPLFRLAALQFSFPGFDVHNDLAVLT